MHNEIKEWGIPKSLQERNIKFIFNAADIKDEINSFKSNHNKTYYNDLQCEKGSVKFCLYDFDLKEILFTMDFHEGSKYSKTKSITLKILYVNDPELRNKGIATYYLKRLQEYAIKEKFSCIKVHPNPNDKLFFNNKKNALSKQELINFYDRMSNEKMPIVSTENICNSNLRD